MFLRALIDTNVVLDVWLERQPFLRASALVLDACERGTIGGLFCASSVTDLYYIGRKELGEAAIRSRLRVLTAVLEIASVQSSHIRSALDSPLSDFEDAVLEAVATESAARYIITRNTLDFSRSPLAALDPEAFLKLVAQD